jgi:acetoin utilization protein AcuB
MKLSDHFHMPTVVTAMTPFPHTIHVDTPVPTLVKRMEEGDFRHLPVVAEGELVGIISIHDVDRLIHPDRGDTDRWVTSAAQVMTPDPYVVAPTESLAVVLREMIDRRIGTTLVVKREKLVGIVTVTDVCRILAELLEDRYGSDAIA